MSLIPILVIAFVVVSCRDSSGNSSSGSMYSDISSCGS